MIAESEVVHRPLASRHCPQRAEQRVGHRLAGFDIARDDRRRIAMGEDARAVDEDLGAASAICRCGKVVPRVVADRRRRCDILLGGRRKLARRRRRRRREHFLDGRFRALER